MTDDSTIVEFELDGETIRVDRLDYEDPTEDMVRAMGRLEQDDPSALFDMARLMGVNTTGWRTSKAGRFFEALREATEMAPGESAPVVESAPRSKAASGGAVNTKPKA